MARTQQERKAETRARLLAAAADLFAQAAEAAPGFAAALYGGMAVLSGLATAVLEAAWYGATTNVNWTRVWDANQSIARGLRPAHWVFVVAASLTVVFVLRRLARKAPMVRVARA